MADAGTIVRDLGRTIMAFHGRFRAARLDRVCSRNAHYTRAWRYFVHRMVNNATKRLLEDPCNHTRHHMSNMLNHM